MANTTYDTIKNMKPAPWSKSTVADGNALNQNFLEPTHQKDLALATAIDQVKNTVDGYNETINDISNVANAAKTQATNAISAANEAQDDVEKMSDAVTRHGESIDTLNNNFNTLSAAVADEAEAITNLQNNKQDKIYVDANTISGNGTEDSPYTVIGGNQKELEFVDSTTVTVHKDEQDDKIIYSFSAAGGGGGGTSYDMAWIPSVASNGDISWTWGEYTAAPEPRNIKGPRGEDGPTGPNGKTPVLSANSYNLYWKYSDATSGWTNLGNFRGEQGPAGANGANGANGISPTISTSPAPTTTHPQGGTHVVISGADGEHEFDVWNGADGAGATNYFDSTTISGAGTQASEYGLKTDAAMYLSNTSAYSATYAEQYWDEVKHQYLTISTAVNYLDTTKINIPTGTGYENKTWLYHTSGNNGWVEANSWLCNHFICENGISGIPDMTEGIMHFGLSGKYVNTSGDTMTGPLTVSAGTGKNLFAVASAATLIGASRQTSAHFGIDNNAIGTTWVGVNGDGSNRGFLKYINGGNVGDLNGQGVQVEFGGSTGGEMLLKTDTTDVNTTTKVINVPMSGYNSMTAFDATNGPNYMLRKLSDGRFDIGACVINVTSLPDNTEANTYYFIYDT